MNVSNVSIETKPTDDGARYTVWCNDDNFVTGQPHDLAVVHANYWRDRGYDVTIILENWEEVYAIRPMNSIEGFRIEIRNP